MKKTAKIIIVSLVCVAIVVPIFLAFGCGEKYEYDDVSLFASQVFTSNKSVVTLVGSHDEKSLAADIFEIKTMYESMGGVTVNLTEETYRDFMGYLKHELGIIKNNSKNAESGKYSIDDAMYENTFKPAFDIK